MNVLITGSSGLLARMLIEHLLTIDADIIGIDIKENSAFLNEKRFRFYQCSITDRENLKSIFAEEQPTNVCAFCLFFQ